MMSKERIESEIVYIALGSIHKPPVDLNQIASSIRVGGIRPTSYRHGYTDFSSSTPVIYLNYTQLETRWRFVLAHELAHVMLRMPLVADLLQTRGRTNLLKDEEAFADSIAATILMPDSLIEQLRAPFTPLAQLQEIARLANVSVTTLVARMASSDINIALLHWRKGNDAWHVIDRPGTPYALHSHIRPSATGHQALEKLLCKESHLIVDCSINGRRAKISGRGYRRQEHIFHFLDPSLDIWIAPEANQTEFNSHTLVYDVDNRRRHHLVPGIHPELA